MTELAGITGTDRIAGAFASAAGEDRAALMPYMMGGFPDPEFSATIAEAYVEGGADLVELGIPFSDPLADGPVIHEAATRALDAGVKLEDVLGICRAVSDRVPVVLMAYTNMILGGDGPAAFGLRAREAGAAGVIVPDLPLGEDEHIRDSLDSAGLAVVPLVAPTTSAERLREISQVAKGFQYVVSDVGTTGERDGLPPNLAGMVGEVRGMSEVPVAVGFGIGTPEQAREVAQLADGVIIGSRLIRMATESGDPEETAATIQAFLGDVGRALVRE